MMREENADGFNLNGWLNRDISGSMGFGSCGRDGSYGRDGSWGREGDWAQMNNGLCDPVDFLPADPFGMDLETTISEIDFGERISEAVTGWIGCNTDDYEMYSDHLVAGLSYYWSKALFCSLENQVNYGTSAFEFYSEGFLGSVLDAVGERNFENMSEVLGSFRGESTHPVEDINSLHDGLLLSLGYLGVHDLLSVERVCRSLRSAVKNDTLLWRCIRIGSPWGEKLTDDDLYQLTQRAQGNLQYLSLVHCSRITNDGLKRVLHSNVLLKKLSVPGCMRLTTEGIIHNLNSLKLSGMLGIKYLKLGKNFVGSVDDYLMLRFLLGADEPHRIKTRKLQFYHNYIPSLESDIDDDRALDVEVCPRCLKCKLVFDCPSESCYSNGPDYCRACSSCIERCIGCGRCVENCKYTETFFFHNICSGCFNDSSESLNMQEEE